MIFPENKSPYILNLQHVCFSVKTGFFLKKKTILNDICLKVEHGSVVGMIGANGAGKTTTLNLAAGILFPSSGKAFFQDMPVHALNVKKQIGYLAEIQHPFRHLKVIEWLKMLGNLSGIHGNNLTHRLEVLLDLFELNDMKQKFLHKLSKGQLQRLSFAQTLIHNPKILILDEPMSGLDTYWRSVILACLKQYKQTGGSIIFSSHVLTDVQEIADEICCIDQGRIKWTCGVEKLKEHLHTTSPNKKFKAIFQGTTESTKRARK
ncbi:ABC transporter ATP-binding protein [uncultured Desulfobacter sp.]|uniref:ABC transporter ATP-binding protein n=1 Tax=uncultured Desulfobacter sp. TaxID=240139 RepID=UPI0029F52991|nr:ABC transporter ATP-binding protein [uncultured Desulfobacter sp.]